MIAADGMEHNENNNQNNNEEEDYNEDEDVWNIKDTKLNEDSLTKVCNNDPSISALSIENPDRIDWESEGKSFGANNTLNYLHVSWLQSTTWDDYGNDVPIDSDTKQNYILFCSAIGRNRSIKTFSIAQSALATALPNIFSDTISPFFEHNDRLRNIGFFDCRMGDGNYNSLVSSLSKRRNKSSLRSLEMQNCGIGHVVAEKLITVMKEYVNLVRLSLHDLGFERRESYVALASILQDPRHRLKELNLSWNSSNGIRTSSILANALERSRLVSFGIDKGKVPGVISKALADNRTMKSINLSNSSFDLSEFRAFAVCLHGPNCSLTRLCLYNCGLDDNMATALGNGLNNNTTLRFLRLSRNRHITFPGWQSILVCLRPNSSLEKLNISCCGIGDAVLDEVVNGLTDNSTLRLLYMGHNSAISANALQRLSTCLLNPRSVLEKLDLMVNVDSNVDSETVVAFSNALMNNTKLHSLLFISGWDSEDDMQSVRHTIDERSLQIFSNLFCNKADIESIYTSNHTLHTITDCGFAESDTPEDIASYLKLNENDDKVEVVRQKLLQYHFVNGTCNIEEFVDMEWGELPQALAWVGRNDTGHSLLYKMCQSMPVLFDTESKAKTTGRKRKYGC